MTSKGPHLREPDADIVEQVPIDTFFDARYGTTAYGDDSWVDDGRWLDRTEQTNGNDHNRTPDSQQAATESKRKKGEIGRSEGEKDRSATMQSPVAEVSLSLISTIVKTNVDRSVCGTLPGPNEVLPPGAEDGSG